MLILFIYIICNNNVAVALSKGKDPIVLRIYNHRETRVSDSLESLQIHIFSILLFEWLVKSSVCKLSEVAVIGSILEQAYLTDKEISICYCYYIFLHD